MKKQYLVMIALLLTALMLCACGKAEAEPAKAPAAQAPAATEKIEEDSGEAPAMPTVADKTGEVEPDIHVETPTMPTVADEKEGGFNFDFGVETPTMPTIAEAEEMDIPAVDIPEEEEISYDMDEALGGAKTVAYGQEQTAKDLIKFTLDDAYLAEEILPSQPGFSYNYLAGTEGYQYLVIKGTLSNISSKTIMFDSVSVGYDAICTWFQIDGKLYMGRWITERPDGSSITTRIEPGETAAFYIYAGVTDKDCESLNTATMVTGFKDLETSLVSGLGGYTFNWDECTYKYAMEIDGIQ